MVLTGPATRKRDIVVGHLGFDPYGYLITTTVRGISRPRLPVLLGLSSRSADVRTSAKLKSSPSLRCLPGATSKFNPYRIKTTFVYGRAGTPDSRDGELPRLGHRVSSALLLRTQGRDARDRALGRGCAAGPQPADKHLRVLRVWHGCPSAIPVRLDDDSGPDVVGRRWACAVHAKGGERTRDRRNAVAYTVGGGTLTA